MKEHPILFNTEMVKAVLDGRKTQTRRVMDFPKSYIWNHEHFKKTYIFKEMFYDDFTKRKMGNVAIFGGTEKPFATEWFKCPYGQKGDRLWVRETFLIDDQDMIFYKAQEMFKPIGLKWKPSIFMPRNASRITLEITDIRVERVQDISDDDAIAEGLRTCKQFVRCGNVNGKDINTFSWLWDSINKKRGYGWELNPWVWVVEFKRIDK